MFCSAVFQSIRQLSRKRSFVWWIAVCYQDLPDGYTLYIPVRNYCNTS